MKKYRKDMEMMCGIKCYKMFVQNTPKETQFSLQGVTKQLWQQI